MASNPYLLLCTTIWEVRVLTPTLFTSAALPASLKLFQTVASIVGKFQTEDNGGRDPQRVRAKTLPCPYSFL
jgi:hypothetical protein